MSRVGKPAEFSARIYSWNVLLPLDTQVAFLHLRAAARWGRCVGTHRWCKGRFERQREWPHEAEALFVLTVHALRSRAGRSGGSGPGEGAVATGPPATPP